MIISLKWLSDFVDVKEFFEKPEVLAEVLTGAGLEVENIVNKSKDFNYVVIGHILEKAKHPNSDKLSLCRVTTGEGVVHQIVCGAQNHKTGDWVVLALPGAVLPGPFPIKVSTIRGIESGGMLCSVKELGLAKESDGIMIIPPEQGKYQNFADFAGLTDVTPNRADCLSHFGLAREISCLLGRPLIEKNIQVASVEMSTQEKINLQVLDLVGCPRYTGRYISGVKIGPSPQWIVQRLQSVGMNSINNVVDVTNYVMLELGQPMHAFDAQEIRGGQVRVQKAQAGQSFTGLDAVERKLKAEDLVICDEVGVIALAGVFGGLHSGVSDKTTEIFLESAYFDSASVRKTSRGHGLATDSAYRFMRGVDPELCFKALDRATELLQKVAGGQAFRLAYDIYPHPVQAQPIEISLTTLSARLGFTAELEKFKKILSGLFCKVEELPGSVLRVTPPTFRFDLETDMDLVEEYARIHGYEFIPESLPALQTEPLAHDLEFIRSQSLRQALCEQGYSQSLNMAFSSHQLQNEFCGRSELWTNAGLPFSDQPVKLLNALSEEQNIMRQNLTLGLVKNLLHNVHQGNSVGRIFEIGKVFSQPEPGHYEQSSNLSMLAWGQPEHLWQKKTTSPLVLELKEALLKALENLGVYNAEFVTPGENLKFPFLHRGQQALVKAQGRVIGFLGTAHPQWLEKNKIRVPVALAEITVQTWLQQGKVVDRFAPISRMPVVERDLALVMGQEIPAGSVQKAIVKKLGSLLRDVEIFDLYQDEALMPGQKSVAFRLHFQDPNATLQEEGINKMVNDLIPHLHAQFSLSVR